MACELRGNPMDCIGCGLCDDQDDEHIPKIINCGGFQIGKFYKHTTGQMMHIISGAKTTGWGWCLIAEIAGESDLRTVGNDSGYSINWVETTENEWLKNFS